MAVTYGFYDSLNHDRLYNAQQMSAIFDGIINDGVFMSVGNQFHTIAGSGMQVIVKSGRAWFDSTWTLNDAEYPLSIDAADVLLTRIDAVVLEVNSEVATRANTIKVVKGTPASTPAKPTLTNTATIHQHALAYVTVAKNITAITNSMIEIVVGKTETPYVTAILQTTDITDLYNQWEDYFQTWFDTVRGTLDGDVALNLQNQITSLRRETLKNTTPPIIGLPASATPDDMFQALAKTGDLHVWRKTTVTPAGTTTTYPVSTNPNAYQEGSDAKPAGYTLGEVETGKFALARGTNYTVRYANGNGIKVNDDGTFNLPYDLPLNGANSSTMLNNAKVVIGRTIQQSTSYGNAYTDFPQGKTYFIPSDAITGSEGSTSYDITNYVTKRQLVTGYAAIPAGTTIEYLGKLGDKAREQVVSYVGTGTYGRDNKNHLTFSEKPRFVMVPGQAFGYAYIPKGRFYYAIAGDYVTLEDLNCVWDDNTNTMTWYHTSYPYRQYNESGRKYTFVAIY